MFKAVAFLLLVLLLFAGLTDNFLETTGIVRVVTNPTDPFFEAIKTQRDSYTLHRLSDFVPVQWDKAFAFMSYVSKEKMYEKVGYRWRRDIAEHNSEPDYTMVFMLADKVVYDFQGPGGGVSFYDFKTESQLNNEALVLVFPSDMSSDSKAAFFVVVPDAIAAFIKQTPDEFTPHKQYGLWRIDPEKADIFGRMVLTKERVVHIAVSIRPGYYTHIWALYEQDEAIPVIEYVNLAELTFEDVTIQFLEEIGDNTVVMLSFIYEGQRVQYRLPFLKVTD